MEEVDSIVLKRLLDFDEAIHRSQKASIRKSARSIAYNFLKRFVYSFTTDSIRLTLICSVQSCTFPSRLTRVKNHDFFRSRKGYIYQTPAGWTSKLQIAQHQELRSIVGIHQDYYWQRERSKPPILNTVRTGGLITYYIILYHFSLDQIRNLKSNS